MRPTDPRVLRQLRPARGLLVAVVVIGVLLALLLVAQAFVVAGLVVAAVRGEALGGWALATVVVIGGRALLGLVQDLVAARAATVVGSSLRDRLVTAVIAGRVALPEGEIAALSARGVTAAEPFFTRYLPTLVLAGVLPALTLVVLATQDLLAAGIVLATLPLVPVFGALVGLATRDRAREQWRVLGTLSGHFLDVMRGLPTLVAYRRTDAQTSTIRRITDQYRRATVRTLRIAFASSAILEVVATLSVALVAVVVGVRLAHGGMDLETALVVLLLAPEAYWPLRRVGAEFHASTEGLATFERIEEVTTGALPEPLAAVGAPGPGAWTVRDVSVTYPGRTTPALDRFSASFPARGLTAVIGPSGAGKSTLLTALASAGGTAVSWLPQRPGLLSGSVADNLRLGRPEAQDEELWEALRQVALEERVRALPGGLHGEIGEMGRGLSAGERARLALARVVVARRAWVLLDEPTAHLDAISERIVLDTVLALAADAGVVVVAHRDAWVAAADHVVTVPAAVVPDQRAEIVAVEGPAPATAGSAEPSPSSQPSQSDQPLPTRRPGFVLATLLGSLSSLSGVALTATAGWLIVKAAEQPPVLTLMIAVVGVRAFGLARPVLRYAERLRSHDAALRLLAERRVEVYESVVPLVPARMDRRRGDVLSWIVEDVECVVDRPLRVQLPVRTAVIVGSAGAGIAAALLPAAGAVVLALVVLGGAGSFLVARAASAGAERRTVELRASVAAGTAEVVHLAPELRAWGAARMASARVLSAAEAGGAAARRAASAAAAGRALALIAVAVATPVMAWVAAAAVVAGDLSAPTAALLMLVPLGLSETLLPLAEAGVVSRRTDAAEQRLHALTRLTPAVQDPTHPVPPPDSAELELRQVRASLGETPALEGVDLLLPAGARVGVTGPSGSGKSTLAALLLRFIDPSDGWVSLGGEPLRDLRLDDVRGRVALVDDDPHVFATTVFENLRLARPGASEADVRAVLHRVRLGDWLDALPDGLHTWLGEGHSSVSGGERARLGLARALLTDAPVLVLDEPTAQLDRTTATEVAQDLLGAARDRSLVWITHGTVGLDRMDAVLDLGDAAPTATLRTKVTPVADPGPASG